MIKKLIRHGNSKALVLDKALLQAAGLDEDKADNDSLHKKAFREVLEENDVLMKRLAKR